MGCALDRGWIVQMLFLAVVFFRGCHFPAFFFCGGTLRVHVMLYMPFLFFLLE